MLLEVAETARETQTHQKLMAATSAESKRLKIRATASFSANQYGSQANAYAGGNASAICSTQDCTEPVPTKLIESSRKRSPDKDPSDHHFMCADHFGIWRYGGKLMMKNGHVGSWGGLGYLTLLSMDHP